MRFRINKDYYKLLKEHFLFIGMVPVIFNSFQKYPDSFNGYMTNCMKFYLPLMILHVEINKKRSFEKMKEVVNNLLCKEKKEALRLIKRKRVECRINEIVEEVMKNSSTEDYDIFNSFINSRVFMDFLSVRYSENNYNIDDRYKIYKSTIENCTYWNPNVNKYEVLLASLFHDIIPSVNKNKRKRLSMQYIYSNSDEFLKIGLSETSVKSIADSCLSPIQPMCHDDDLVLSKYIK